MDAVDDDCKHVASWIGNTTFNLLAFFLSPMVCGLLMKSFSASLPECSGQEAGTCPAAIELGFRVSLFCGLVACLFSLALWVGGCFVDEQDFTMVKYLGDDADDAGEETGKLKPWRQALEPSPENEPLLGPER